MRWLLIFLFLGLWTTAAFAHGGGLDASGCHNDRKRGEYHCHRGNVSPPAVNPAPVRREPLRVRTPEPESETPQLFDSVSAPATLISNTKLTPPIEGRAQVLDGDTIQIGTTRIRLYGIDAFEGEQRCTDSDARSYTCGGDATRALTELVEGEDVLCVPKGSDAYGRLLAVCRVTANDLSASMARSGHALAYTKYALDYVIDERAAKQALAGAWSGTFEMPWTFRISRPSGAAEAQRSAVAPSARCVIKGNVNKRGERIYHMVSDPFYDRTKPENWFCSVGEAEQAGFRRAGNP